MTPLHDKATKVVLPLALPTAELSANYTSCRVFYFMQPHMNERRLVDPANLLVGCTLKLIFQVIIFLCIKMI